MTSVAAVAPWGGSREPAWTAVPLKYALQNVVEKEAGEPLPFVALEHIEPCTGRVVYGFDWSPVPPGDYARFQPGDILFGKLRPYLRKVIAADRAGCCPTELLVLRPSDAVYSRFAYYLVQSEYVFNFATSTSYGVKMPRTSWSVLGRLLLNIPRLSEQRAIAAYLDRETARIDALVAKKQQLTEMLDERLHALVETRVLRGAVPRVELRETGMPWLGSIPGHWSVQAVWMLFELGRGRVISHEEIQNHPGPYPVYSSQSTGDGAMGHLATYAFSGDYLTWTTDGAYAGTVFRRRGKFNCTNVCGTLHATSTSASLDYFCYALDTVTRYFVRQDINPKLMNNVMARIRVPVPPLEEQAAIARELDVAAAHTHTLRNATSTAIDQLIERRQALITAAVTGQIDVPSDCAPAGAS